MGDPTKLCPYCAEEIRSEAVKCRYCGSLVEGGSALSRTWYRRRDDKMLAGVCAGLADQFGISVTIIRLAFLLSALVGGGVGVIIYLALWMVMPYGDRSTRAGTSPTFAAPPAPVERPTRLDRDVAP
jgi:phage shock protein PspC (stress-responsive transcriptional regulator)